MGIFSKLFGRKDTDKRAPGWRVGGTEDFMTLIRVYYQAVLAANFAESAYGEQSHRSGRKEKVPDDDERTVRHAGRILRRN